MRKRFIALIACGALAATSLVGFAGCGGGGDAIKLKLWGPEAQQNSLKQMVEEFKKQNPDQKYSITVTPVSEGDAYSVMSSDPTIGADVFAFAADQTANLYAKGALSQVSSTDVTDLEARMGNALDFGKVNDKVYAYPISIDNGFFMYYDSSIMTAEDAKSLDTVLQKCNDAGKEFIMAATDGWYTLSFAYGMGGKVTYQMDGGNYLGVETNLDEMGPDGTHSYAAYCAQQWIDLSKNWTGTFKNGGTGEDTNTYIGNMLTAGKFGAAVTGMWNASKIQLALGDHYEATRLPDWKSSLDNKTYKWASFAGAKCFGVNDHSKNLDEAHKLAAFLVSDWAMEKRFDDNGICPASKTVAALDKVKNDKAASAINEQIMYSSVLDLSKPQSYWDAMTGLATDCEGGNVDDLNARALDFVQELRDAFEEAEE